MDFRKEIAEYFEQFRKRREEWKNREAEIVDDVTRSVQWKRDKLNEEHRELTEVFDRERKAFKEFLKQRRSHYYRRVFEYGTSDTAKFNYRNALETAKRTEDKTKLLEEASLTGDKALETATLKAAYDANKYPLLESYEGNLRPGIEDLNDFDQYTGTLEFKFKVVSHTSAPALKRL